MMKAKPNPVAMKKKKYRQRLTISSLPQDLFIELAMHVAAASPTPLADLKSLRATCKRFYHASKEKMVGQCISVEKEWMKHWWDKEGYFVFLQYCANSGNLEASFILGLEEVYNLGRRRSGLHHLQRAMEGGHCTAAYLLGIMLFHDPATRSSGMDILNKVACGDVSASEAPECTISGNPHILRCRREAMAVVWKISMKKWAWLRLICQNQLCGRMVTGGDVNQWMGEDGLQRTFCSQLCRWSHEYCTFFGNI